MNSFASRGFNSAVPSFGTRFISGSRNNSNITSTESKPATSSNNLNSRYIDKMAQIIKIILNVRNTSLVDLQGILTNLDFPFYYNLFFLALLQQLVIVLTMRLQLTHLIHY